MPRPLGPSEWGRGCCCRRRSALGVLGFQWAAREAVSSPVVGRWNQVNLVPMQISLVSV